MPFFDRKSRSTWKVQPSGNYSGDCSVGCAYALEFLKSCDGTVGWANLLNQIAHDMVTAGPMREKWNDGSPRANGIIIGFMSTIGKALACTWSNKNALACFIETIHQETKLFAEMTRNGDEGRAASEHGRKRK